MSYNKQTWNEYNDSQTADENSANGAIISADRLNHMETGISNNDINKVTDNHDNTITANGTSYDLSKSGLTSLQAFVSGSYNDLPLGTAFVGNINDGPDNLHSFTTTTFYFSQWSGRKAQIAIADSVNLMFFRICNAGAWHSWIKLADDSTVVHTADMRKPASDVVGLEDIKQTVLTNGTDLYTLLNTSGRPLQYSVYTLAGAQTMINKPTSGLSAFILTTNAIGNNTTTHYNYTFLNLRDESTGDSYEALIATDGTGELRVARPWHKVADDSKVAHLSGANNFDTVPTYGTNNKPFAINDTGATTARPTGQAVGYQYFDTTLNKPIWYNGSNWVDSTGTTV